MHQLFFVVGLPQIQSQTNCRVQIIEARPSGGSLCSILESFGAPPPPMTTNYYESSRILDEYLLFHYGNAEEILEGRHTAMEPFLDFPARCVSECVIPFHHGPKGRALDLGCAVGRATFELSRHFEACLGIDFSSRFITAAEGMRVSGEVEMKVVQEGDQWRSARLRRPPEAKPDRVEFRVGDALALPPGLGVFDAVLMANLIDRLSRPGQCLEGMAAMVRPGGLLVVTSPYTWLDSFTPREHWLPEPGPVGTARGTRMAMERLLAPQFELLHHRDMPFLIREHARKFQWSVAEATIWVRTNA